MYISFPRKIRGKDNRLSITIPKAICEDYGIQPGDFILVTLEDKPKDPTLKIQFSKRISKCGSEGRIVYIPMDIAREYNLQGNTKLLVTLEEV